MIVVLTTSPLQVQRYEGASTIYGPHTLQAYIQEYSRLAASLAKVSAWPIRRVVFSVLSSTRI